MAERKITPVPGVCFSRYREGAGGEVAEFVPKFAFNASLLTVVDLQDIADRGAVDGAGLHMHIVVDQLDSRKNHVARHHAIAGSIRQTIDDAALLTGQDFHLLPVNIFSLWVAFILSHHRFM